VTKNSSLIITLSLLLSLSNIFGQAAEQTIDENQNLSVTYKEIGDQLISSLGIVEKEKETETTEEEKFQFIKELPTSLTEIRELNEGEKLKILFELLEKKGTASNVPDMPPSSYEGMKVLIKELELFYRNDTAHTKEHLFSEINNTQTVFGQAQLSRMLTQPIDDIAVLRARQNFIRKLVQNEKLFNDINEALNPLAQKESDLLSFWENLDTASQEAIKFLHIPFFKKLNTNATLLSAWNLTKKTLLIAPIAYLGCQALLSANLLVKIKNLTNSKNPDIETKKNLCLNLSKAAMRMMNSYRLGYLSSKNKKSLQIEKSSFKDPLYGENTIEATYKKNLSMFGDAQTKKNIMLATGLNGAITGLNGIGLAMTIKREQQIFRYMQTRLSGAAALLKASRSLQNIIYENPPYVAEGLFLKHLGIEHLEEKMAANKYLANLVGHLKTKTFDGDYSFFSRSSRIIAAFELIKKCKDEFAELMQYIGELDACLSIAKLYKKLHNNENASYCFVEFVEQDSPYLRLEDFWNPMIATNKVVTNSIEFNAQNNARNILLTGSNTGGKSTILKGAVINILFSRLGIAPARRAIMTPFTYLATSLNISDNTAQGISLFNAEVLRAKNIVQSIKALKPGQHSFVAIDELFVGTASDKGSKAAYKFADHLRNFENNICLLATHFKTVTELEEKTNGIYKNYKIDIIKNADGTLTRPFKLEEGISDSNVANEILQENIGDIDFL